MGNTFALNMSRVCYQYAPRCFARVSLSSPYAPEARYNCKPPAGVRAIETKTVVNLVRNNARPSSPRERASEDDPDS